MVTHVAYGYSPGQGSNLSHSGDLRHRFGNTGSLTCSATAGTPIGPEFYLSFKKPPAGCGGGSRCLPGVMRVRKQHWVLEQLRGSWEMRLSAGFPLRVQRAWSGQRGAGRLGTGSCPHGGSWSLSSALFSAAGGCRAPVRAGGRNTLLF